MARKMRDSGVEWIGEVPEGWEIRAIKKLALTDTSLLADGDWINSEDMSHDGIRYLTTGNIGQGAFKEQGNGYISDSTFRRLNCLPVYGGDLVISRLNEPIGRACIIPKNYKECVVAVDCVVLRPDEKFDKKFLMYAMSSDRYAEYGLLLARGTTMQRISRTQLGNMTIPIPPLLEQRRIADYLDEKCAAIDGSVDELKRGIEDCKAWKKAIIFEAVTGKRKIGFNAEKQRGRVAERPIRDSGIPWIGEIPEGWEVSRVKYICKIQNGQDPKTTGDIPVYGSGETSFKTCGEYKEGPAVLLGRKGATLHIPHYIESRYWNVDTAFDVHMKGSHCLKWFYYLAVCFDYRQYISQTTLPGMTQTNYNNMSIPLPSRLEQQAIADYLDEKCAAIDALVAEKEKLITDLEAYKKSLIFELVTGKREVA